MRFVRADQLALHQGREDDVLAVRAPHALVAREAHHRAGRAEEVDALAGRAGVVGGVGARAGAPGRAGVDLESDGGAGNAGVGHLGRHRPPPDEPVQPQLVAVQKALQRLRGAGDLGRADRLVGLLGVPGPGRVRAHALVVLVPVAPPDEAGGVRERLAAEAHGVGAHIGDQAFPVAPAQVDPLVELLGERHGAPGGHAQHRARELLQGRGDEGWGRAANRLLLLHAADAPGTPRHRLPGDARGGGLVQHHDVAAAPWLPGPGVEVLAGGDGLAAGLDEVGGEAGSLRIVPGPKGGSHTPVRRGLEPLPLLLPLDQQAEGRALDAAGAQLPPHPLPQHRGERVPEQAVEHAAGFLGANQLLVHPARVGEGGLDGRARDFVEGDALHGNTGLQDLNQVPTDGLALPVLVGREDEFLRPSRLLAQGGDVLLRFRRDDVDGLEVPVDVDAQAAPRP